VLAEVLLYHWYPNWEPTADTVSEPDPAQNVADATGCVIITGHTPVTKLEVAPVRAILVKVPDIFAVAVKLLSVVIPVFVPPATPWLKL
jgi:hypothetical protein